MGIEPFMAGDVFPQRNTYAELELHVRGGFVHRALQRHSTDKIERTEHIHRLRPERERKQHG